MIRRGRLDAFRWVFMCIEQIKEKLKHVSHPVPTPTARPLTSEPQDASAACLLVVIRVAGAPDVDLGLAVGRSDGRRLSEHPEKHNYSIQEHGRVAGHSTVFLLINAAFI